MLKFCNQKVFRTTSHEALTYRTEIAESSFEQLIRTLLVALSFRNCGVKLKWQWWLIWSEINQLKKWIYNWRATGKKLHKKLSINVLWIGWKLIEYNYYKANKKSFTCIFCLLSVNGVISNQHVNRFIIKLFVYLNQCVVYKIFVHEIFTYIFQSIIRNFHSFKTSSTHLTWITNKSFSMIVETRYKSPSIDGNACFFVHLKSEISLSYLFVIFFHFFY